MPLHLGERHLDGDAGGGVARQVDGDDFGVHPGLDPDEKRRAAQPHVPRRGVDAERRAARDGLPREVGDVPLQLVLVGPAGAEVGLQVHGELAVRAEDGLALLKRLRDSGVLLQVLSV